MGKGELATFVSQLRDSLEELNVPIKMQCPVSEDLIAAEKPDAIVVATGAKPLMPSIPGMDGKNVVTAEDILLGNVEIADGQLLCVAAVKLVLKLLTLLPVLTAMLRFSRCRMKF